MTREGLGPTTALENDLHDAGIEANRQVMEEVLSFPEIPVPENTPRPGDQSLGEYRRRFPKPPKVTLLLGDGAPWIWELRRTHFPHATEILDFYHASEHLKPLLELAGLEAEAWKKTFDEWKGVLLAGQVGKVIETCEALAVGAEPAKTQAWHKALNYYRANQERMKYDEYEAKGWFIGSGVVESACKTLVGSRFKQSGMLWSRVGADAVLPLRTLLLSKRYDEFWNFVTGNHKKGVAA